MQTSKILLGHLIAAPGGFAAELPSLGAMSWVQSGLSPSERVPGFCPQRCWHHLQAAMAVQWDVAFPQASPCCVPGGMFVF